MTFASVQAQDSLQIEEKTAFGHKMMEKFNFTEKLQLFKHISSSRQKSFDFNFDKDAIWEWEGMTIRSIQITVLDPFEHINPDSLNHPKLFNTANKVHRTTSERMIKNDLIFKEGDQLDPQILIANQQILYENSYFRDATIYLSGDPEDPAVVDVHILVQDLWSWLFIGQISGDFIS